jgi:hypothetical protein
MKNGNSEMKDILSKMVDHQDELDKLVEESAVKIDPEQKRKQKKAIDTMEFLDIPCNKSAIAHHVPPTVYATDLYDILMDEEKLRVLVTKLRNKAFW